MVVGLVALGLRPLKHRVPCNTARVRASPPSPYGVIGSRAGFKFQCRKTCRFESD